MIGPMMRARLFRIFVTLFCASVSMKSLAAERLRSAQPFTVGNKAMSLTIAPDGSVILRRGESGPVISNAKSDGWSVYQWVNRSRTALDNMQKIGPNLIRLWSTDGKFQAKVAIKANEQYLKFDLIHVSNNPGGRLDDDWPGHRVEFDLKTKAQDDGWELTTIRLNPMSELKARWNYRTENGAHFRWPYPQWAQTDYRPQPQGSVAVFGSTSDAEHDDILSDLWVAEPSLPRPNRAKRRSWTRADVDAWVDECEAYYGRPWRMFALSPTTRKDTGRGWAFDPGALYPAADLAAAAGLNGIYMSQHHWQGHNIGDFNLKVFPGGRQKAIAWRKHCDSLGIHLHFHGFSHLIRKTDPDYGWAAVHDELAKSARGTLLQNLPAEAKGLTVLVDPDWDYHPGMKEGMLPFYDINKLPEPRDYNGGVGGTFPPYYENMASLVSLNRNLYRYTATVTPEKKWRIVLGDGPRARVSRTPLVNHKVGDRVDFILTNKNGNYFLPDSRSDLLVDQAIGYAQLLNDMKTGDGYDGSAWTEDLGSWGLRRFSQEVYERMDHAGGGSSALGIRLFGHFEANFRRIREAMGDRGGNIPVFLAEPAMLAPSLDDASMGAAKSSRGKDIGLRAIHSGLNMDVVRKYGLWKEAGAMLSLWSALKPHLSPEQARMVSGTNDDFYAASETESHWYLTKTRAMRREGIDGGWNVQPERPPVAPRQFLKADGTEITGLHNPYAAQSPVVELHIMANMSSDKPANVSLMPASIDQVINPDGAEQGLTYDEGVLELTFNNSQATESYAYDTREDKVGYWLRSVDMSESRGVALTITGDGSGSTLVFSTGGFPRMYAVDVDFVGERTIEIPNGEVVNNREGWNIFECGTITQFDYSRVDRFRLFLQRVPAGRQAHIEVTAIKAMNEDRSAGLVDPVLTLNGVKARVAGKVPYDHYLVYCGGSDARVYDPNWNLTGKLPVRGPGFSARCGPNSFRIMSTKSQEAWISSRIKVEDVTARITINKPTGKGRD